MAYALWLIQPSADRRDRAFVTDDYMADHFTLFGMAGSLFTAKVRAYMRKNKIEFTEITAGAERYRNEIAPKINRWIIPVIETPDGTLIQDGTDILDYFERAGYSKASIYPQTPRQRAAAHLFELFGSEGMMRPAMYYRWNFDEINLPYLRLTFRDVLPPELDGDALETAFQFVTGRMRKAAGFFGANDDTASTIEESYTEFLRLFEAHLSTTPYLLGHRPTIGDYALLGPLYPHLGRDPAPLHLMQKIAPNVFRWTERMNIREGVSDAMESADNRALFADDDIPDTLVALMKYIAEDYLPELRAHIEYANAWLQENPDVKAGENGLNKPSSRAMGFASFSWRGHEISTSVMMYRFYLQQRLHQAVADMSASDQDAVVQMLDDVGLRDVLELKTTRPVLRKNHIEVWGE